MIGASLSSSGAAVDPTAVKLYVDGTDVTASAQVSASAVSYTLAQPLREGTHTVRVTARDVNANSSETQWTFLTRTDPTITAASPKDVVVPAGTAVVIAAQFQDVGAGIEAASARLTVDGVDGVRFRGRPRAAFPMCRRRRWVRASTS